MCASSRGVGDRLLVGCHVGQFVEDLVLADALGEQLPGGLPGLRWVVVPELVAGLHDGVQEGVRGHPFGWVAVTVLVLDQGTALGLAWFWGRVLMLPVEPCL
jgi:hypothetical protein